MRRFLAHPKWRIPLRALRGGAAPSIGFLPKMPRLDGMLHSRVQYAVGIRQVEWSNSLCSQLIVELFH